VRKIAADSSVKISGWQALDTTGSRKVKTYPLPLVNLPRVDIALPRVDFAIRDRKLLARLLAHGNVPAARAKLAGKTMHATLKKAIRTLQSELPFVKEAKDTLYLHARRKLRVAHDRDFIALRFIPPYWPGSYVDVGANQGQSIESIQLFRPDAQIISFEANAALATKLATRYEGQKNVRVVARGLAESAGKFTLFVPSYKGFVYDALASFDKKAASSWINEGTVFRFDASKLKLAEVECQVETLDAQQLAPLFIKLDVQGYEYNVLAGARETLKRYEPIVLVESFGDDARSVQLAKELGYEEYHFGDQFIYKGAPVYGPNSFLMTRRRYEALLEEARKPSKVPSIPA